jgi:RHS repeat-associated protein
MSFSLILAATVNAQSITDGSTPLALSPGAPTGSYPLSDLDSVGLYNGNLGFRLPLVKIAGRGGAGYTMSARIEQKWLVDKEPQPGHPNLYTPTPNWWNLGVFSPIYSAGRMDTRQAGSISFHLACSNYIHDETLTRLTFTAPDGTEYELRDQATNGRPDHPSCTTGLNRGRVFVTSDGSSATFTSDSDISDWVYTDESPNIPPSGYLAMRDGTQFRVDGGTVTWMRDRNGNKVSFAYDASQRVTTVTDSLNRQIAISYAAQIGSYDSITFEGFGGATRTIKVYQSFLQYALRSDFSLQTYQQLFPELNGSSNAYANLPVVSAIELPNGQQYHFYYNSYAELARVVLPTGGAVEYDHAAGLIDGAASGVLPNQAGTKHIYRRVIERRVYPDGGSGSAYASRMTYSRPESSSSNAGYVIADQYNSSGSLLTRSYHYFYGSPRASFDQGPTQYPGWKDGREYQTTAYASNGTTPLRQTNTVFAQRAAVSWWSGGADQEPPNDPRVVETDTTLSDTNQVSKQTFAYDDSVPFNNQSNAKEYDFGSGAAGALLRETRTTYVTSTSYTSTNVSLLSLPSQVSIYDGGGTERARTVFEYDNYATDSNHAGLISRSSISGFDSSFSTSYTTRGNVTGTTHYILMNGSGSVSSYAQYDIAGNVVKTIDARGNATNIGYADCFGAPDNEATTNSGASELGGLASYAFPTSVTNAANQTAYAQFDYYLGSAVNAKDINGTISSASFNDSLDRPTQVQRAVGTAIGSQTAFSYDDAGKSITTTTDQTTSIALKTQTFYDGFGRTIETRAFEGGTNYITSQTQYDALGRAYKSSNPFRPWQSEVAIWTTSAFDALSRVTSITTPDSAVATTSYSGNTVTASDQTSKSRKSVTDALGRLTSVYEDPSGLAYQTSYSYDVLDDLTGVSQGSQTHTFVYNSLKELTSGTNPESGTVSYQYDANGDLTQKTDARGVVTTFGTYDVLNRPTTRSYSDGTPTVTYSYDSATNGKGRLASVSSSVSTYTYGSYDALGRTLTASQTLGSQTYSMSYGYDLAGHVTSMTYPSGRTVSYSYDSAGRTSSFSGNLGDGTNRTYSTAILYSPFGGMTKEQFGTNTTIYNKLFYNSRGQLSEIREGTSYSGPTDTGWERGTIVNHYSRNCWGMCGGSNTTTNMSDDNGTVKYQDHWIQDGNGNVTAIFTQNFDYDALNRLQKVYDGSTWQQQYVYDRYGNRTIDQANTFGTGIPKPNYGVDTTTNRLTAPSGSTMSYDGAGNLTFDNSDGIGGTRTYDAENRMKQAWANSQWQTYTYDSDGRRVKRIANSTESWYVYGIGGELVAEYAANGAPSSPQKEYGYRNGQLLVTAEPSANIHYLVADQLGTPRIILDQSGSLANVSRHDYLPFGEELFAGMAGRTTGLGYINADGSRQKFTQKERDIETGLDYFGARSFASTQGRFTSADDVVNDSHVADPQSWNKYAYVRNNPLKYIDQSGQEADVAIKTDERNKTGTITIKATIGIWTKDSKNISQDALNQAASGIKSSIDKAWSGQYEKDGITYTVKTEVTVQAYSTEQKAIDAGSQNVVEMIKGNVSGDSVAESGRGLISSYDSGTWNIDRVGTRTIAHEFGHLLGAGHGSNSGENLMTQSAYAETGVANANDYGRALGGSIDSHRTESRQYRGNSDSLETRSSPAFRLGPPESHRSQTQLRAARFWWN